MALEILHDPRVRAVPWRDLRDLRSWQVARELTLWVPWALGSWALASMGLWPAALPLSFFLFLVGLRIVHDAYHHNLGGGRRFHDAVILLMSALMLGSMHAVQFNHLRHHKHCMDEEDIEAWSAKMPAWKAILFGPAFPILLHHAALTRGSARVRRWVLLELALTAGLLLLGFAALDWTWLRYHLTVMLIGHGFTAFFAVWTVHHDCDSSHHIARTIRGRFKTWVTLSMFYHIEHHLFPQVPTCKLEELSARLDEHAPELSERRVF